MGMQIENFIGSINNEEFLNIMYEIFPKKIEEKYEKLLGEVRNYISNITMLKMTVQIIDDTAIASVDRKEDLGQAQEHLAILEEQMREALDLKDFIKLNELSSEAVKMQSKIQGINAMENRNSTIDISMQNSQKASELQAKIENNINNIKKELEEIEEIKINDNDRLDNLLMHGKHVEMIKNMLKRNGHTKNDEGIDIDSVTDNLAVFLTRFLELKKQIYKTAEKIAPSIVNAYEGKYILDYSAETDIIESYSVPYSDPSISDRIYNVISSPDYSSPIFEDNFKKINETNKDLFYESAVIERIINKRYEDAVELIERLKPATIRSNPDFYNLINSLARRIDNGEVVDSFDNIIKM